jgi:ABC-type transporter MlaC component
MSIVSRRLFLALPLFAAFAPANAAAAAEGYVQDIGDNVLRLANAGQRGVALRNKFANLLGRYVNLRTIAMTSLGTFRSKLPPGDKEKLHKLVTTYAAALFAWYVDDFKGKSFEVERTATQGKFTVVYTKIKKSGRPDEPIVWYLQPSGSGFSVVDISVLGVRLSVAMRDRFQKELRKSKGDFSGLYAVLADAENW